LRGKKKKGVGERGKGRSAREKTILADLISSSTNTLREKREKKGKGREWIYAP